RAPNQRVAFAILQFNFPQIVNKLIREGLYTRREKLHPMKEKREPIRCVCCQHWGHIGHDCKATHKACATCGREHRKEDCTSYKTYYYVSCEVKDHSSSDHHCPTYLQKRAELNDKHPENTMPLSELFRTNAKSLPCMIRTPFST
ncbi:hypothetical protein BDN67DRAFT_913093, partial [Paxillus ammoniavirescens]